jgi:hypothetical protein
MEPISAITAALVAGATAAASGTASQAVKDAYQGLKTLLVEGYMLVSTALLEKRPSNPAYQKAVEDELKESAAVVNDKSVLEKTQAVHDALRKESPAQLSAWGVDIKNIEAAGNFIAERISGSGGGLRSESLKAGGDVRLSDISGGGSSPGKT